MLKENRLNDYRFSVSADHPVLAGHFPGCPIVPGSLILDHVLRAWGRSGDCVVSAKFHVPLGPDELAVVRIEPVRGSGAFGFRCLRGADLICSGRLVDAGPA
jgi:3-hydroxymyristoyl/3-hydroxydecanoyl-(acyl carrier protein) dehydratase